MSPRTDKTQEQLSTEMDTAAAKAGEELRANPKWTVSQVAEWWKKHYLTAGHKRLAHQLMSK